MKLIAAEPEPRGCFNYFNCNAPGCASAQFNRAQAKSCQVKSTQLGCGFGGGRDELKLIFAQGARETSILKVKSQQQVLNGWLWL